MAPIKQSTVSLGDFLYGQAQRTPALFGLKPGSDSETLNPYDDFLASHPEGVGTYEYGMGSPKYREYLSQRLLAGRTPQQYIDEGHRAAGITNPQQQGGSVLNPDGTVTMYIDETPDIGETLVPALLSLYVGGALGAANAAGAAGAEAGAFGNPEAANLVAQTGSNLTGGASAAGAAGGTVDLPLVDDWSNWMNGITPPSSGGTLMPPADLSGTDPNLIETTFDAPNWNPDATSGLGQAATKLAGSVGETAAKSLLGKLISGGDLSADDWGNLLGALGSTALGLYGANKQTGALERLASQFAEYGAPSRARYEGSFAPGFTMANEPGYKDALDTTSEAILRKLSVGVGNPFGSPGGLIEANKAIVGGTALPALYQYRNQNAATGGFGAFNTAAPGAASLAASTAGNVPNVLGSGLADVVNPRQNYSLADLAKALNLGGLA